LRSCQKQYGRCKRRLCGKSTYGPKKEDFGDIRGLESKVRTIEKLSKQLNLGLDSFVLLDDNELERETVRINLPEVSIAEFPGILRIYLIDKRLI
jgi:predicted enzyme involved in methoxymalonyl-ACP biosynthesis